MNNLYKKLEIVNTEIEIINLQQRKYELIGNKEKIEEFKKKIKEKREEKNLLLDEVKNDKKNMNNNKYKNKIILDDCMNVLPNIASDSIDLFLSDIPYGINLDSWDVIHNNTNSALLGSSPAQRGKSGFKKRGKPINGWNNDDRNNNKYYEEWCYKWATMLFDVMKEGAPVLLFGGRRTIHSALNAMERAGFLVKDVIAWKKDNAHHRSQDIFKVLARRGKFILSSDSIERLSTVIGMDLAEELKKLEDIEFNSSKVFIEKLEGVNAILKKEYLYDILDIAQIDPEVREQIDTWRGWRLGNLAPIYEPIGWLFKPYSATTLTDNLLTNKVGAMNINDCKIDGKSPTNVLEFGFTNSEAKNRLHDAQKPLELIKYLIKLTTLEGQTVLDPFVGSGTTALACKDLNRDFIAIERDQKNYEVSRKRIEG